MEAIIRKGRIEGSVAVPSSKSILQRFMIGALLAHGETELEDVHHCNDTEACLAAITSIAPQDTPGNGLHIKGNGGSISPMGDTIHCGESGFALRALTAVAALGTRTLTLTGSGSLPGRPLDFFSKVLPVLGVECRTNSGFLPISVKGPLQFKDISVDGSLSSQFLSGLLMVYPLAPSAHVLEVHDLKSKRYVDLTIQVMKYFGVTVTHENYQRFFIPGNQDYKACKMKIEGDWSAASFMLVAGAIAGTVTIENLNPDSLQPDRAIVSVLNECGAEVKTSSKTVSVTAPGIKFKASELDFQTGNLKPFKFDATDCPDLFPPLVALAVQCAGISEITGVERLVHKESNRALALQQEFSKLNINMISIEGNKMIIRGGLPLQSTTVDSHNDHRIAMSLAVAGLNVEDGIHIRGCESVRKSFPHFFVSLEKLRKN